MGAKTGYADAILRVLGLAPGARAAHYLWCEPDPGVRLLLEAYRDAGLAKAAAAIIWSWAAEDPRELWERLRAEGPPRLPATGPEVARWVITGQWAYRIGNPSTGYAPRGEPRLWSDGYVKTQRGILPMAEGVARALTLPATVAPDARTVDPREVARWVVTGQWAYRRGSPESGFAEARTGAGSGEGHGDTAEMLASRWSDPLTLPATIAPDARVIEPPALPPGTVCYMDPPYVGTTGYAADLPRSEVVTLAQRWHAAGARVCISEAEPMPELVADGWHAVRIDGERRGQKRTFSKQQAEWLTLSHPPAWRPWVQEGLFA